MATIPDQLSKVETILRELNEAVKGDLADPANRHKAVELSKRLTYALEDPLDRSVAMIFSPFFPMAVRISVDLGLFDYLCDSSGPTTTSELADLSKSEELLVARMLSILAGIGFVDEIAQNKWSANSTTKAMTTKSVQAGYRLASMLMHNAAKAPDFIRETGNKCPTEPRDGVMQYAQKTKLSTFEWLATKPSALQDFNLFMGSQSGNSVHWLEWFPVEERLLDAFDSSALLLVDIGGGKGHDIQKFQEKYPGRGRLILQDLPQVIDGIAAEQLHESIERQGHDMFTPEPVAGARVYFMKDTFHNWSDKYCLTFLRNLYPAMKAGYSKLLLNELIMPDSGATAWHGIFDMINMTCNNGMIRTRSHWTQLLAKAGFEVLKIWVKDAESHGVVEAWVAA